MTSEVSDPAPAAPRLTPEEIIGNMGYVMLSSAEYGEMQTAFHSDEFTDDAGQRLTVLRALPFDDFKDRIEVINGLVRKSDGSDANNPESSVAVRTAMGELSYIPPDPEDKESLLAEMYAVAQNAEDIQDSALVIGLAINAVHPFPDGNGRTSRFVYDELAGRFGRGDGLDPRHTLTETYGRKNINLGYRLPERLVLQFVGQRHFGMDPDDPDTPRAVDIPAGLRRKIKERSFHAPGLDENQTEALENALVVRDSTFLLGTMYKTLRGSGKLEECMLDDGDNTKVIDVEKALAVLGPDALRDMMEDYRKTKAEYIRTLCDCIVRPNDYPVTVAGAPMTLRSLIVNNTINYLASRRTFHRPK